MQLLNQRKAGGVWCQKLSHIITRQRGTHMGGHPYLCSQDAENGMHRSVFLVAHSKVINMCAWIPQGHAHEIKWSASLKSNQGCAWIPQGNAHDKPWWTFTQSLANELLRSLTQAVPPTHMCFPWNNWKYDRAKPRSQEPPNTSQTSKRCELSYTPNSTPST